MSLLVYADRVPVPLHAQHFRHPVYQVSYAENPDYAEHKDCRDAYRVKIGYLVACAYGYAVQHREGKRAKRRARIKVAQAKMTDF